jgi:3-hydroxyisobutyrate dehydrogenase
MNTSSSDNNLRAGVIGLGQIGGGVAICLARHQRALAVYDVRPQAADKLEGVPAALSSPAEVARASDVLMIAVLNGQQIKAVLEGPDGILAAAHPGLSLVILSTITMAELQELREVVTGSGVALLDCGVTGGQLSDQGGMISMIGGEDSDVERIRPVLEEFNAEVHHMGGSGAGMATKIARNMIHFTLWRAGVEGAMLATKAGVNLDKFIDLVEAASKNPGASVTVWMDPDRVATAARMAQDPIELRRQTLGLQQKDLEAAKALAAELGVNVAAADAAWRFGKETYRLDD